MKGYIFTYGGIDHLIIAGAAGAIAIADDDDDVIISILVKRQHLKVKAAMKRWAKRKKILRMNRMKKRLRKKEKIKSHFKSSILPDTIRRVIYN